MFLLLAVAACGAEGRRYGAVAGDPLQRNELAELTGELLRRFKI